MPVKNAGPYLVPCLDSILAQSHKNWELIAINDGSTDASKRILVDYASKDGRIKVQDNRGSGIVKALQLAYEQCSGQWVHRMDADDLMPESKLKLMFGAAEVGSLVTGKVEYFCDERTVGEGFFKYVAWLNGLMDGGDFWRDTYKECSIPSSAWLIHKIDFDRIGAFNSALMPEDYDFSFNILKHKFNVIRLQEVVHKWRDSETRTSRNEEQYFPIAYIPIKVHYFLELHRSESKELVLWGAGKKGKRIAKELIERRVIFTWVTDNIKKQGKDIYGVILKGEESIGLKKTQLILAMSSPEEQVLVQERLDRDKLINNEDFFWFF